jgi:hypothetical protein
MRLWIVVILLLFVLGLAGAIAYFGFGWGRPSLPSEVTEISSGYDAQSEPTTLSEALASAHEALNHIERDVHDYSAVIVKQERIGSKLVKTVMFAKIREKPFSVYLNMLDRSDDQSVKGREVIYVDGRNKNCLQVHTLGFIASRLGTMSLDTKGRLAMLGERYPITEIGVANLCRQLIKRGESAPDPSRATAKRYRHARINDRACYLLEIMIPAPEKQNWGYLARVFVDDEYQFPLRVEVFELPLDRGKGPQLIEEYTYLDLKVNNGYTDADFDTKNRQYKFP